MWVPSKLFELFAFSKENLSAMREDLAALRAERDLLKLQLGVSQNTLDWLRMQVNSLQFERVALMEKAHGIRVPAPTLTRLEEERPEAPASLEKALDALSFDDLGDDLAKRLGLPLYNAN